MIEERGRFQQVLEVFQAALDRDPQQRAAFLARECGDDEDLRRRVEALLAADEQTSSLLEEPVAGLTAKLLEHGEESSAVGRCIGVHRLRRVIGRGGIGTIYLADRVDGQYQEQVAIKLIRRGMDSDAILRRFRRERQILADLHHPNIARLLDGGMTEEGTPYFVMKYIDGMTIDRYCDDHQLRIAERVELLRTVCAAVQAAHRRLVVHCDLKPSNILVTQAGVPKLLDFGIARILSPDGDPDVATLTAGERQMTPVYASPEQIRGHSLTTATDVYSLGVVLYELLTGRRPYYLDSLAHFEIQRAVCEEEPEKPSDALGRRETSAPGEPACPSPAKVCRERGTTPEGLHRRLAGDLDNIVLRAIRKPPEERYGSVEQLSEDLRRHLMGLPVRARPATAAYRAAKFLRRHRLGVAAAILLLLSLLGGIGATLHQAREARQRELTAERALGFLIDVLVGSDPDEPEYGKRTLRDVLDEAAEKIRDELDDEPLARSSLMHTIGEVYGKLGYYDEAEPLLESALTTRQEVLGEDHADVALTMHFLGALRLDQARLVEAEQLFRAALEKRLRLFGEEHVDVASSLNNLALVLKRLDKLDEAEALHRRALGLRRRLRGERHLDVSTSLNNLAMSLQARGSFEEAEERFREALDMRRELFGPTHYRVATSLNNLAYVLRLRGKLEEAQEYYREALAVQRRLVGRHPSVAATLNNLAVVRNRLGDHGGAEALLREALALYKELLGADHPQVIDCTYSLAAVLRAMGRYQDSEGLARQALELYEGRSDRFGIARAQSLVGACLTGQGRFASAEALLLESLAGLTADEGAGDPRSLATTRRRLMELYEAWGKVTEADRYRPPSS